MFKSPLIFSNHRVLWKKEVNTYEPDYSGSFYQPKSVQTPIRIQSKKSERVYKAAKAVKAAQAAKVVKAVKAAKVAKADKAAKVAKADKAAIAAKVSRQTRQPKQPRQQRLSIEQDVLDTCARKQLI